MGDFDKWFRRFARRVEKALFNLILCLLLLLFISQAIMTNPSIRHYLSTIERLEGLPIMHKIQGNDTMEVGISSSSPENKQKYHLVLEVSYPGGKQLPLDILINGNPQHSPAGKYAVLSVEAGDLLEIKGDVVGKEPVVLKVLAADGLQSPAVGKTIETFGDTDLIGWVVPASP